MKFNTMNSVIKLGPQKRVQALMCVERVHWEPLGHELCVGSRGFRQAVPLALCPPQAWHPLGSEDMFLQDRAVLCSELAMGKLEVILV